ncbi:MAG: hypothetical protein P1U68_05510 [Verrucomicrobiales bacterium]|nr:hypothetical protein [Verrucomicrobiales bacterium]
MKIHLILATLITSVALFSCEKKSGVEKAADDIGDAAEEVADEIGDAARAAE